VHVLPQSTGVVKREVSATGGRTANKDRRGPEAQLRTACARTVSFARTTIFDNPTMLAPMRILGRTLPTIGVRNPPSRGTQHALASIPRLRERWSIMPVFPFPLCFWREKVVGSNVVNRHCHCRAMDTAILATVGGARERERVGHDPDASAATFINPSRLLRRSAEPA